jgi:hypothetical protein
MAAASLNKENIIMHVIKMTPAEWAAIEGNPL